MIELPDRAARERLAPLLGASRDILLTACLQGYAGRAAISQSGRSAALLTLTVEWLRWFLEPERKRRRSVLVWDALLTMLTRRHGRLTVKARGLRRKNSPLIAPCQLLAYGEFTLFEYRGQYTINEAQSIELFTPLRRDLTKLSLGTYFAQVSEVLSQEDMPNPELQSLLLNCLYALSKLNLPESQVKAVFELRAACLSGYTPDLTGCHVCGSQTPERFDLSAGMLECRNCRSPE